MRQNSDPGGWIARRTRRELVELAAAAGAGAVLAGPLARSAFAAPTQSYDDGTNTVPGGLVYPARRSTADGAMSSGIREAKRLLRRPAVGLSAG